MDAKDGNKINREFFHTISPVYDKRTAGDWKSPSAVAAKAKPLLSAQTKLLDFGVGTGAVLTALDVSVMQSNIFAVDVASGMIDVCRNKFPDADIRQITSACEISSFGWPQFDLILSSGVFEYIERIDNLLCVLKGILNQVGELIFTYQPIISHHPKQFDRVTKNSWTVNFAGSIGLNITQDIETITFRWHAHEVHDFCRAAGLEIVQHESFVAYYDPGPGTTAPPRIYNLVRAKSRPP
jgi:ubiquinone/menaquinone biosynthesis C-methylase UbiE